MANGDFIAAVIARKLDLRIRQKHLESETGISQGHLSKILSRKVPLTEKSKAELERWLARTSANDGDLNALMADLRRVTGERRANFMQIMHLLAQLLR